MHILQSLFGASAAGAETFGHEDAHGDSLLSNNHAFYRDALKEGPQLTKMTEAFLAELKKQLDALEKEMWGFGRKAIRALDDGSFTKATLYTAAHCT